MLSNLSLLMGTLATVTLLIFPVVHLMLVALNFVAHFFVLGLQLLVSRFASEPATLPDITETEFFVSIHVPTHNEPPEVVLQTLRSLSNLDWPNYEVLVIDNNTTQPDLWVPVQKFCETLGPKFRFFHVESLPGFKAGAMNYVRKFMDPRADFIFVVDADYIVNRNALRVALRYATNKLIGLIQFPQDYRNVCEANLGIALDYRHFFSGFMNASNRLGCVASTGTLALINVAALEKIEGFNPNFVTEDAELGLRLALHGYRSIYVNESIGFGLIPHELDGLKKQRWRWAFGNAQILRRHWRSFLFAKRLSWKQKLGFFSHLTAWFNFNLIPSLSLILLSFASLFHPLSIAQIYTVVVSGFTLGTYFFLKYGIIHYSLRRDGYSLADVWRAFLTHVGLEWIFSASWIRCLINSSSPFVRTNKFLAEVVPGVLRTNLIEICLGIGLIVAALILALTDFILGPMAAAAMFMGRLAIFWVWSQTRHTFLITMRLSEAVPETVKISEIA